MLGEVRAAGDRAGRDPFEAEGPVRGGVGRDREALEHLERTARDVEGQLSIVVLAAGHDRALAQVEDAALDDHLGDRQGADPRAGDGLTVLVDDRADQGPEGREDDVADVGELTVLEGVFDEPDRGGARFPTDVERVVSGLASVVEEEAALLVGEGLPDLRALEPHGRVLHLHDAREVDLEEPDAHRDDRGPVLLDDAPGDAGELACPGVCSVVQGSVAHERVVHGRAVAVAVAVTHSDEVHRAAGCSGASWASARPSS